MMANDALLECAFWSFSCQLVSWIIVEAFLLPGVVFRFYVLVMARLLYIIHWLSLFGVEAVGWPSRHHG